MRSSSIHASCILVFFCLAFTLPAQTMAQADTTPPPAELDVSEAIYEKPSFEGLNEDEKRRVLEFILSRGLSEEELLELAFKSLPAKEQEKVMIYADFIKRSREDIPVTNVEYFSDFVEFGELTQGEEKMVKVRFKNHGPEPYIITETKESCPCLEIHHTETVVMPGEEGEIYMIAKSAGFEPTAISPNGIIQDNSTPNRRQIIGSTGLIKKKHPNRSQL